MLSAAAFLGFSPYHFAATLKNTPAFFRQMRAYRAVRSAAFPVSRPDLEPILTDYRAQAGIARGHYFHQDLWAARKIAARRPQTHVDIGSRIDGFVAHLLTVMPVTVIDIRPLESDVEGLTFHQADATRLDGIADGSVESLSSLHAVEHIGLGRYGDAIDPDGWRKAIDQFKRVLKPGGYLYLSVPIGRQRLCFNAHRVFYPRTIVDACAPLRLVSFSAVTDADRMVATPTLDEFDHASFSCGLFEFQKADERA